MKIAIFASGSGSNAENLYKQLHGKYGILFPLLITDNENAGVRERAARLGLPCIYRSRAEMMQGSETLELLKNEGVDLILLAGFLGKIAGELLNFYEGRIINLHPALLPKFGGKGMYGDHVHKAVLEAKESISGITFHFIDKDYDKGQMICQVHCPVYPDRDTIATLSERIHRLEHLYYPLVVKDVVQRIEGK